MLSPIHDAVSANLGAQVGANLHRRLLRAATEPLGIAHPEEPELADDFTWRASWLATHRLLPESSVWRS